MKKYIYIFSLIIMTTIVWSAQVKAHVLLRDPKVNIGAVLHINPDDDPIAGEISELYFDLQDQNSQVRIAYSGYELIVTDEKGTDVQAPLTISDTTLIAKYNFPSQGLYKLTLRSKASYDQFQKVSMEDSLRVSRGINSGARAQTKYPLANAVVLISAVALGVLAIVAFNYRRVIAGHSRF